MKKGITHQTRIDRKSAVPKYVPEPNQPQIKRWGIAVTEEQIHEANKLAAEIAHGKKEAYFLANYLADLGVSPEEIDKACKFAIEGSSSIPLEQYEEKEKVAKPKTKWDCPECGSKYTYHKSVLNLQHCRKCGYEWNPEDLKED